MTLNQYLGLRPGARSRCPFCEARRGLCIRDDSRYDVGGVFKCFACDRSGSGVTFLVEVRSMTRAEARQALGLSPALALVDLDNERSRAAWEVLERRGLESTMDACRDLVWLRERMTKTERADWRRHEELGMPRRLAHSEQARRQEKRLQNYRKEVKHG